MHEFDSKRNLQTVALLHDTCIGRIGRTVSWPGFNLGGPHGTVSSDLGDVDAKRATDIQDRVFDLFVERMRGCATPTVRECCTALLLQST